MASCDGFCAAKYLLHFLTFVSVPVYIVLLYTLVKFRKGAFNGSFWTITVSLGIADLARIVHVYWTTKFTSEGWMEWLSYGGSITAWITRVPEHYFLQSEFLGVMILSFNRHTAVLAPMDYDSIWNQRKTKRCIFLQWFLPLLIVAPLMPLHYVWEPIYPNGNNTAMKSSVELTDKPVFSFYYMTTIGIGNMLRVALYVVLYGRMFLRLHNHHKQASRNRRNVTRENTKNERAKETKLMLVGLCLVCVDFCGLLHTCHGMAYSLFWPEKVPEMTKYWQLSQYAIGDVFGWINAWLLIAASKNVRKHIKKTLDWRKANNVT